MEKEECAGVKRAVKTTPVSPPGRAGAALRLGHQSAVHTRLQHKRRCISIKATQKHLCPTWLRAAQLEQSAINLSGISQ